MTKGRKQEIKEMCAATDKMKVFVMNVEAFSSIRGREAGEWFGRKFGAKGLIAVDESTNDQKP